MRLFPLLAHGALVAAMSLSVVAAMAQPAAGDGPKKPPAEALAACQTAAAGSDCSFTSPRGLRQGTCWAPEGKPLACKPKAGSDGAARPKPPAK